MEFDKIYLVWRKGSGEGRTAVGELSKTNEGKYLFSYFPKVANLLQQEQGFTPYTEFQDLKKPYNGNVVEIFGQRLTKHDRPDIDSFYKFWEVDTEKAQDKFYLLGKTQGLLATDNFEFLADYKLIPELHFLTEISALSIYKIPRNTVKIDDILSYELDPSNETDNYAVKVFKDDLMLGYIKKYHSKVFYDAGIKQLKLVVKAIEQNGNIKRIFIKVSN